jgi:seryl-tRNA(Sec) selenium transferase
VLPSTWSERSLLESGALRRVPQHGIGRSMKAGKEEIVGLVIALRRYAERDEEAERERWWRLAEALTAGLGRVPGITARTERAYPTGRPVASSVATIEPSVFGCTAVELVRALVDLDPIVLVADQHADEGILRFDPENLDEAAVDAVLEAIVRVRG